MAVRTTKRPRPATVMIYLAPVVIAAGGLAAAAGVQASAATRASGAKARGQVVVHTETTSKYGKILVDAKGFALYTFPKDSKNHSVVTGKLLSFWPALVVPKGVTPLGKNVRGLGIAVRSNGERQVSYHGKPLYLFTGDTTKGVVTGQGVGGFIVATVSSSSASTGSGSSGSTSTTGSTGPTGSSTSSTSTSSVPTTTTPSSSTGGGGYGY